MKWSFRKQSGLSQNGTTLAQPIEVGTVAWMRELNDALATSASSAKPVFALFQEVPGCAGCKQFGADVLSNRLVVDAVETEFVPLLIHNNTSGRDAEVLAMYGEPAWNYQVVRFLDSSGADLIERRDKVWETIPLVQRMVAALEVAGRPVPEYLRIVEQEASGRLVTMYIAQSCFWVGETELGRLDGVVLTEAGFMEGLEVTKVGFDPLVTSAAAVVAAAVQRGVASGVFVGDAAMQNELKTIGIAVAAPSAYRVAPNRDQKRQLQGQSTLAGLTDAQLTKLNAFAPVDRSTAAQFLPPGQRSF